MAPLLFGKNLRICVSHEDGILFCGADINEVPVSFGFSLITLAIAAKIYTIP